MPDPTFLTRVLLENYKSIASCDVALGPLTFLVGPNGSGKSNFLDALRFVADALRSSLDHAIRDRGGIPEVLRRSPIPSTHFGGRFEFRLRSRERGFYAFQIRSSGDGGYEVEKEDCWFVSPEAPAAPVHYSVRSGEVVSKSAPVLPVGVDDRLYLVRASGVPEFRPIYEALSSMGFYHLNPDRIRDLEKPDQGELLARDGNNLASVLAHLATHAPSIKVRIEEYLAKAVPGVQGVDAKTIGPMETLEFRQQIQGKGTAFLANNMSDGTLRALGVLVALFQSANGQRRKVPLVGIEEPEIALHPAAVGMLFDAVLEASRATQILVTSHSPDLLDDARVAPGSILAVAIEQGITWLAPLDEVGRSVLKDRLYTPGELLRLHQLLPDPESLAKTLHTQPDLFAPMAE